MDLIISFLMYGLFNWLFPEKSNKEKSNFGVFYFGEDKGIHQHDNDPYLNSNYDDGPGW